MGMEVSVPDMKTLWCKVERRFNNDLLLHVVVIIIFLFCQLKLKNNK